MLVQRHNHAGTREGVPEDDTSGPEHPHQGGKPLPSGIEGHVIHPLSAESVHVNVLLVVLFCIQNKLNG